MVPFVAPVNTIRRGLHRKGHGTTRMKDGHFKLLLVQIDRHLLSKVVQKMLQLFGLLWKFGMETDLCPCMEQLLHIIAVRRFLCSFLKDRVCSSID